MIDSLYTLHHHHQEKEKVGFRISGWQPLQASMRQLLGRSRRGSFDIPATSFHAEAKQMEEV
jgi:hypothetical protein